jgi:DNA primase
VAANKAAAVFYADRLQTPEAAPAREFLAERGFDVPTSLTFGCGFAPGGWDELTKALRKQGFTDKELVTAGLSKEGQRGLIDRFNRRLLWQIRDVTGDVVGFGARRLFDDDRIEAKYLNTSDTPLYHKSQVLYGLDLAKKQIRKERRAVVVEGYTDVMAMHAAGVTTAVASCGTAFGDEHIGVLRRFLMDSEVIRGEVVYTFDGDAAGRNAALKAFDSDQKFAANTYIAVAPDNLDPCELRQKQGDAALRDLVETKKPLFAFAIGSTLSGYDLNTAEGRVAAGRATVPLVARIKETDLRDQYVNELSPQIGMEPAELRQRVKAVAAEQARAAAKASKAPLNGADRSAAPAVPAVPTIALPKKGDRLLSAEREALKLALQQPGEVAGAYEELDSSVFTHPAYAALHEAVLAAGGPAATPGGAAWVAQVREQLAVPALSSLASELANERMTKGLPGPDPVYAGSIMAALAERAVAAQIKEMEAELKRAEAAGDATWSAQVQGDLFALQQYRRALVERANRQI